MEGVLVRVEVYPSTTSAQVGVWGAVYYAIHSKKLRQERGQTVRRAGKNHISFAGGKHYYGSHLAGADVSLEFTVASLAGHSEQNK